MPAILCKSGLTSSVQHCVLSWKPCLLHCFLLLSFHLLIYMSAMGLEIKNNKRKKNETQVNSSHSAKAKSYSSSPLMNAVVYID